MRSELVTMKPTQSEESLLGIPEIFGKINRLFQKVRGGLNKLYKSVPPNIGVGTNYKYNPVQKDRKLLNGETLNPQIFVNTKDCVQDQEHMMKGNESLPDQEINRVEK